VKRDIDLYRQILLAMEECPSEPCINLRDVPGVPHDVFAHHVGLLHDAGLITAANGSSMSGVDWQPLKITHAGYEFLDNSRNDGLWAKTKDKALSMAGTLSLEAMKVAMTALMKSHLL
jgi:hypothetical protein